MPHHHPRQVGPGSGKYPDLNKCSEEDIVLLASSADQFFAPAIALYPITPPAALMHLLHRYPENEDLVYYVLAHERLNADVLDVLADSLSYSTRIAVAEDPRTRRETLVRMHDTAVASDEDCGALLTALGYNSTYMLDPTLDDGL